MDELEHEAIQTDIYLDRLLASRSDPTAPDADQGPLGPEATDMRDTAALLRRTMVRFHPSFRFEEQLAARLQAETRHPGPRVLGRLIAFPRPADHVAHRDTGHADAAVQTQDRRGRGLIVGGAIASGVSLASIAGVVLVWRRSRGEPAIHLAERLS